MPLKKYNVISKNKDERKVNSVPEQGLAILPRLEAKSVQQLPSGKRVSAVAGDRPQLPLSS